MGIKCQILLNKTKEGYYKGGQTVTGVVKYIIEEPIELCAITITLVGTGKCSWREHRPRHDDRKIIYQGHERIIKMNHEILDQVAVVQPDCYEHPFSFQLPSRIPPSYQDSTGSIKYKIKIKFEKTAVFSFNKNFSIEIPVHGIMIPRIVGPASFDVEKKLMKLFTPIKPKVKLNVEINDCNLIPGEDAHLILNVTNDTDVKISSIKTELYSYTVYTGEFGWRKSQKFSSSKEKYCCTETPEIPERGVTTLTCVVPTRPDLYSIQNSNVISREYKFKVTVRLPMPHTNTSVEVPVVIGERMEDQTADPDVEEPPPSYWETMCEDKEKE